MEAFRIATSRLLEDRRTSITFLKEIVKNIIDHADHGYMLVVKKGEHFHFFSASSQDPDMTPETRKLRRPVQNSGVFKQHLHHFVAEDARIVDQFSHSSRTEGISVNYTYRGRIIEQPW